MATNAYLLKLPPAPGIAREREREEDRNLQSPSEDREKKKSKKVGRRIISWRQKGNVLFFKTAEINSTNKLQYII